MFDLELDNLTSLLRKAFAELGIQAPQDITWVPTPFSGRWGVGTAACFRAAADEAKRGARIDVPARAREIAEQVVERIPIQQGFESIVAEQAYINAYFDTAVFASHVVNAVIDQGEGFGRGKPKDERLMVEYVQPNTHHSFHIGHARTAVLGESLARLAEFAGFDTVRASYPGDIGLGVITCLWYYNKFYKGKEPHGVHERGRWLAKLYTEATALLTEKEDESPEERAKRDAYEIERREMYKRWDAGDPEVRELWRVTRQWSLDEFDEILKTLGVKIDVFFFESEVDEKAKAIVEELIELGIAEDERPEGPVIVKIDEKLGLKKEKYRTAVILRSDGTTLYLTKDLALAKEKFERYKVDRSVYVVDVRQSLHFQQVFKILELWGFPQAKKCYHLAYGFVTLPEGAMSSRLGNVIYFMDVADEAKRRVLEIIAEKNPDLPEGLRDHVAEQVGLGALTYAMLSVDNNKDIVFKWDEVLNFDGQTAPYIQNAHVRANSILKKAGRLPSQVNFEYALHPMEVELIDRISRFPRVVQQSALEYKPLQMANYAYDLAKTFHAFYHTVPVIKSEPKEVKSARLRLTAAARQTLASSLRLLAIQAPDVM